MYKNGRVGVFILVVCLALLSLACNLTGMIDGEGGDASVDEAARPTESVEIVFPTFTPTAAASPTAEPEAMDITTSEVEPTETPDEESGEEATPTEEPDAESTPPSDQEKPASGVESEVIKDAVCMAGPSNSYSMIGSIKEGTTVEVLGKGVGAGWFVVKDPRFEVECWVRDDTVPKTLLTASCTTWARVVCLRWTIDLSPRLP